MGASKVKPSLVQALCAAITADSRLCPPHIRYGFNERARFHSEMIITTCPRDEMSVDELTTVLEQYSSNEIIADLPSFLVDEKSAKTYAHFQRDQAGWVVYDERIGESVASRTIFVSDSRPEGKPAEPNTHESTDIVRRVWLVVCETGWEMLQRTGGFPSV